MAMTGRSGGMGRPQLDWETERRMREHRIAISTAPVTVLSYGRNMPEIMARHYPYKTQSSAYYTGSPMSYSELLSKLIPYHTNLQKSLLQSGRRGTVDLSGFVSQLLLSRVKPEFAKIIEYLKKTDASVDPMRVLGSMSIPELKELNRQIHKLQQTPPYTYKSPHSADFKGTAINQALLNSAQQTGQTEYIIPFFQFQNEYSYAGKLMGIANMLIGKRPAWYKGQLSFVDMPDGYPFIEEAIIEKEYKEQKRLEAERLQKEREKSDAAWDAYLKDALRLVEQKFAVTKEILKDIFREKQKLLREKIAEETARKKLELEQQTTKTIEKYGDAFDELGCEQDAKKILLETVKESEPQMNRADVREAIIAVVAPRSYENITAEEVATISLVKRPYILMLAEGEIAPHQVKARLEVIGRPAESYARRIRAGQTAKTVIAIERKVKKKIPAARKKVEEILASKVRKIPKAWRKLPDILRRRR